MSACVLTKARPRNCRIELQGRKLGKKKLQCNSLGSCLKELPASIGLVTWLKRTLVLILVSFHFSVQNAELIFLSHFSVPMKDMFYREQGVL